jgi:hypothetical protein
MKQVRNIFELAKEVDELRDSVFKLANTTEAEDKRLASSVNTVEDQILALPTPHRPLYLLTVLCGGLLGAFLSLALLWFINPASFEKPKPEVKPVAATIPADPVPNPAPSIVTPVLFVTLDSECWVEIRQGDEIAVKGDHYPLDSQFEVAPPATVRSGCPGQIHYWLGGREIHPRNESKAPSKSEIVTVTSPEKS